MQPTSNAPGSSRGAEPTPHNTKFDPSLSNTEPTSGPIGSSYRSSENQGGQPAASGTDQRIQSVLDSSFQHRAESGIKRDAHDVVDTAKDLGSKALHGIKTLSTGQIAAAVGVLAAGIAFFATRGKKNKYPKERGRAGRAKGSSSSHQPHTVRGNDLDRRGQRPYGNSRYGAQGGGAGRVQAGSGYGTQAPPRGQRRDQGPAEGNRYNPRTSGRQNPNNIDQLNSAY